MSNLDKRAKELASVIAPNTSGLDPKLLIQALSDSYQKQAPTAFAYGMTPEQVATEDTKIKNLQQNQQAHMAQALQTALNQDKELADRVYRGQQQALNEQEFYSLDRQRRHSQGIAEKQLKLQEAQLDMLKRAEDVELRHKKALADKDEALARKSAREADMLSKEADIYELAFQTSYPVPNPQAGQTMVDEKGNAVLDEKGNLKKHENYIQMPLAMAKEYGLLPKTLSGANAQKVQSQKNFYLAKGVNPADAEYLSNTDLNKIFIKLEDLIQKSIKNKQEWGESLGEITVGTDILGNPQKREMTADEYSMDYFQKAIPRFFPMLTPETQRFLQNNIGMFMSAPATGELTDDQLVQLFLSNIK